MFQGVFCKGSSDYAEWIGGGKKRQDKFQGRDSKLVKLTINGKWEKNLRNFFKKKGLARLSNST